MKLFTTLLFGAALCCNSIALYASGESESYLFITRGEFIALCNEEFNLYDTAGTLTDIAADHPYYYDILAAYKAGYLVSDGGSTFDPDAMVTRAEAAMMLSRLIDLPVEMDIQSIHVNDGFPNDLAVNAVEKMAALGIMPLDADGNGNFDNHVTRQEAEKILGRVRAADYSHHREDEILSFTAYDGFQLTGRLCTPANADAVDKLVIYVNGSGPNTYLNNEIAGEYRYVYHNFIANNLVKDGTAYFSYNTRGVEASESAPFRIVNDELYKQYLPENSARDIKTFVDGLRKHPKLTNAKMYLLGWSEGTITAAHALIDEGVQADALFLAGYAHGNMADVLDYQLNGARDFYRAAPYFDSLGQDYISREAYGKDPYQASGGKAFEDIDVDNDGKITENDFKLMNSEFSRQLYDAIERNDNAWIAENYPVHLTAEWFNSHFNYGKNIDTLVQVDVPVYIFQGTYDYLVPYQDALLAEETFKALGKTNLTVKLFDKADHDLHYTYWLVYNIIPEGFVELFHVIENQ